MQQNKKGLLSRFIQTLRARAITYNYIVVYGEIIVVFVCPYCIYAGTVHIMYNRTNLQHDERRSNYYTTKRTNKKVRNESSDQSITINFKASVWYVTTSICK
jgi:hypothetical protein